MTHNTLIRNLALSISLVLASSSAAFAYVGGDKHDQIKSDTETTLTDKVENGDLITTAGNGENSAASGDVGKNAYTGATHEDDATKVADSMAATDDTTVTAAVKTEIAGTDGVNVSTTDGVVMLSGSVSSNEEKMRLAKVAAEVEGVKQVDVSNLLVNDSGVDIATSDEE